MKLLLIFALISVALAHKSSPIGMNEAVNPAHKKVVRPSSAVLDAIAARKVVVMPGRTVPHMADIHAHRNLQANNSTPTGQPTAQPTAQPGNSTSTVTDDTDDGLKSDAAKGGVWLSALAGLAIFSGLLYYMCYGNPLDHLQAARQREAARTEQGAVVFSPLSSGNPAHDQL